MKRLAHTCQHRFPQVWQIFDKQQNTRTGSPVNRKAKPPLYAPLGQYVRVWIKTRLTGTLKETLKLTEFQNNSFAQSNNGGGDWGNVCDRRRQRTSIKNMATHLQSMHFFKLNLSLFDLMLLTVLPKETMNNLRFVWHQVNGTLPHLWVAGH